MYKVLTFKDSTSGSSISKQLEEYLNDGYRIDETLSMGKLGVFVLEKKTS